MMTLLYTVCIHYDMIRYVFYLSRSASYSADTRRNHVSRNTTVSYCERRRDNMQYDVDVLTPMASSVQFSSNSVV